MKKLQNKLRKLATENHYNTTVATKLTGEVVMYLHKQEGNFRHVLYLWRDFDVLKIHTARFYLDNDPPKTAMEVVVLFRMQEPKIINLGNDEKAFMERVKKMLKRSK